MLIDGNTPEGKLLMFRNGFAIGEQAKKEGIVLRALDCADHHMRNYKNCEGWRYRAVSVLREAWIEGFLAGNASHKEEIPEGKPFGLYVREVPEKRQNRNCLRVDALGQFDDHSRWHCDLRPLTDAARRNRHERGRYLEVYASQFALCTSTACRSCPVAKEQYPELGLRFLRSVV